MNETFFFFLNYTTSLNNYKSQHADTTYRDQNQGLQGPQKTVVEINLPPLGSCCFQTGLSKVSEAKPNTGCNAKESCPASTPSLNIWLLRLSQIRETNQMKTQIFGILQEGVCWKFFGGKVWWYVWQVLVGFCLFFHDKLVSDKSNYLTQTTTLCNDTNKIIVQFFNHLVKPSFTSYYLINLSLPRHKWEITELHSHIEGFINFYKDEVIFSFIYFTFLSFQHSKITVLLRN